MKKGYSFFLFTLFLLSPLISSAKCIDWYLVTIDNKTGKVIHEQYLTTSCDGCGNEMCLEDNNSGGNRGEIHSFFNSQDCSDSYAYSSVGFGGCEFQTTGKTTWGGYGQWDAVLTKVNFGGLYCAIWNSTAHVTDTGSKATGYQSKGEVITLYKGNVTFGGRVTMGGFPFEASVFSETIRKTRIIKVPNECFLN